MYHDDRLSANIFVDVEANSKQDWRIILSLYVYIGFN